MRRLVLVASVVLVALAALPGAASASELIGRSPVPKATLSVVDAVNGRFALLSYAKDGGGREHVCLEVRNPLSRLPTLRIRYDCEAPSVQKSFGIQYTWPHFCRSLPASAIRPPDSATRYLAHEVCHAAGRTWMVQFWQRGGVEDYGGTFDDAPWEVRISTWGDDELSPIRSLKVNSSNSFWPPGAIVKLATGDTRQFDGFATLQAYSRWSKFSPGGYKGYLKGRHYPAFFGQFTYGEVPIYGPGDHRGNPTSQWGRNVYIDTAFSDYGNGWRRLMGVLTQDRTGAFCYEVGPKSGSKGKTGISTTNRYRFTVIGPQLLPDVRLVISGPRGIPFGNANYNPRRDGWGMNFSTWQQDRLLWQRRTLERQIRIPRRGTDCGKTLRQLDPRITSWTILPDGRFRIRGAGLQPVTAVSIWPMNSSAEPVQAVSTRYVRTRSTSYLDATMPDGFPRSGLFLVRIVSVWGESTLERLIRG